MSNCSFNLLLYAKNSKYMCNTVTVLAADVYHLVFGEALV